MLRFASPAMISSSSHVFRQPLNYSSGFDTHRSCFLPSFAQSHGETISIYRRRSFIFSKSSTDPIDFVPAPPLHPEDTDAVVEQKIQTNFSLEDMSSDEGIEIDVLKVVGKMNRRRIRSQVRVDAELSTVWKVLTDYDGLSNFIPGLAVSQLLEKREKFVRLYQVGLQNLPLGLKFSAKGVLECYEGDLDDASFGRRRDIEFKMVEGDFQTFEGRWSIQQIDGEEQQYWTTLSYVVEVEPKLWLPVRLLEGRLCREVKINLLCIRNEAQRIQRLGSDW